MTTTIGSSFQRWFASSRLSYGPRSPTQPMKSSKWRPAARTTPSCAAETGAPQNEAMSTPSWRSLPFRLNSPPGISLKGSVIRPTEIGHW